MGMRGFQDRDLCRSTNHQNPRMPRVRRPWRAGAALAGSAAVPGVPLRAELDAFFLRLYGIDDRDDVDYILETFQTDSGGLKRNEIRDHGDYRTKRLVLAEYVWRAKTRPEHLTWASILGGRAHSPPLSAHDPVVRLGGAARPQRHLQGR